MKTVSTDFASALIDFAPTAATKAFGFGESQLRGTVAAYNMLARNGFAYLADEVGMGKTYVALGVFGLFRHLNPTSRVMVIAPRENIQHKWIKELRNFVRVNWKVTDNRVRSIQGTPVWNPMPCHSFPEIMRTIQLDGDCDMYLRMTTFSARVKERDDRKKIRRQFRKYVPWIKDRHLRFGNPDRFLRAYGQALNAVIPEIDLLIVDEAHNLKHGFGRRVSIRNRMLAHMFGGAPMDEESPEWYKPRVKRLLFLSATPFEQDYADVHRQLTLFGFGNRKVVDERGHDPIAVRQLMDPDVDEQDKREVLRRFMIRRVSYQNINGKKHTKNMYRREWRGGGYSTHDQPMKIGDVKERLTVALVQKKVSEILGSEKFNNQFQIGMLSSFESFLESLSRKRRRLRQNDPGDEPEPVFDGSQDATPDERPGVDTEMLEDVVRSYRDRFGRSLPHPKLDATSQALATTFDTGEKSLVFVRRVATAGELKGKLDYIFDDWVRRRMLASLPDLAPEIDKLFDRYVSDRGGYGLEDESDARAEEIPERDELIYADEGDTGGKDSFFAWFFRGEGPSGVLSGAAFQKNRLSSISSTYSTFFEDNYVGWLLDYPEDILGALSTVLDEPVEFIASELTQRAYAYFLSRTKRKVGYPRFYVYEAYQAAALKLLTRAEGDLAERAEVMLRERFSKFGAGAETAPAGFPLPAESLQAVTFFTELVKRKELRVALWPEESGAQFQDAFRRREQRRELLSAMARLGASYIDLYLLAIRKLGSFDIGVQADIERPEEQLVREYVALLDEQRQSDGFSAFHELSSAARAFDTIISVNFPEIPQAELSKLAEIYGRTLQRQEPVGKMAGGVNNRLVKQFRMPGFPLVLVSTDVLQEGEDLHTFCKNVIHYGITWTPSAMEQRTGRIDRIGSLFQRTFDGGERYPQGNEWIQVYFPHLRETIEVLQVERVLDRLDRFMRMIHKAEPRGTDTDSRIRTHHEMISPRRGLGPLEGLLESAFPVRDPWLEGAVGAEAAQPLVLGRLTGHLQKIWGRLADELNIREYKTGSATRLAGTVYIDDGEFVPSDRALSTTVAREQPFELELRSQAAGSATFLRCSSPVGLVDLKEADALDELYELQRQLGYVKICAWYDSRRHAFEVYVRRCLLFSPGTTQYEEVAVVVRRVVRAADYIESALLYDDKPAEPWLSGED